jgi:serine/threonine protein kinase
MKEKFGDFERCNICGYIHNEENYKSYYLRIKTRLNNDRYELGRVLGSGGFGTTYIAYDHVRKERVAVKEYLPNNIVQRKPDKLRVSVISPKYRISYLEGMKRFKIEAQMLKN